MNEQQKYNKEYYKNNKERQKLYSDGIIICQCGKKVQRRYFSKHRLTNVHKNKMITLDIDDTKKKTKEERKKIKCDCGSTIYNDRLEQHLKTSLHTNKLRNL